MPAILGLIVRDVNFNFSCFVHNHEFCFLQVWCPAVFASSGHRVLLKLGLQDTLSYKVLKKCATLSTGMYTTGSFIGTASQAQEWDWREGNPKSFSFLFSFYLDKKTTSIMSLSKETVLPLKFLPPSLKQKAAHKCNVHRKDLRE